MDDDPIVRAATQVAAMQIAAEWAWATLSDTDKRDAQRVIARYHVYLAELDPRKPIKIEHKSR